MKSFDKRDLFMPLPELRQPDIVRLLHMRDAARQALEFATGRDRNTLDYFNVNLDLVFEVLARDLQPLLDELERVLM